VLGKGAAPISGPIPVQTAHPPTSAIDVSAITAEQAAPMELAAGSSPLAAVAPKGKLGPQYAPEDQQGATQQQQQQQQQQQHARQAHKATPHNGGGIRAL
jgi:predicted small lipoprotein YifL